MRFCHNHALAALAVGILVPLAPLRAADAAAAKVDEAAMNDELAYINALVNANLPDIATSVIEAAKKKWPALGPRLKVSEMQGELRMGRFEKVQKEIDALKAKKGPEYWALKLAMADAYYARDKIKECRALYDEFFKSIKEPGPELKTFYVESGYKWAQMLLQEKKPAEATRIYGVILKQDIGEDAWATIATDCCELLLKLAQQEEKDPKRKEAFLKQAETYVDKLLWKSDMGAIFGRAVALKAHIEMLRGQIEKAQFLVNDYMPQLLEIDATLKEQDPKGTKGYLRMSPVPQCRYLLAKMLWDKAKEELAKPKFDRAHVNDLLLGTRDPKTKKRSGLGAINHSVTVYINYPMSSWAMQAGALVDEIAAVVKAKLGADIKSKFQISPAQMRNVQQMQFRNAGDILREGDYENAVKAYRDVLAQLPEVPDSVAAVASLAEAYLNIWQRARKGPDKDAARLDASAVEGYLAERFSGAKKGAYAKQAGDLVLRLASREKELGDAERSQELYDLYFKAYPTHYNAAQMALNLAGQAFKAENYEKAAQNYLRVANCYSNSTYHATSLQMLAICYGKLGDEEQEIAWLRAYSAEAKRPLDKIATQLRLAQKQKDRGFATFEAGETNTEQTVEIKNGAARNVLMAVRDFNQAEALATKCIDSKFTAPKDKPKFEAYRETALMLAGESLSRLAWPENKISTFRKMAVKTYEKYLSLYPKGKWAPQVLVKIGTIWTAEKNMEESKKAFARLKEQFPDSDEAKNSTPRLAKTLIEMGLKSEGVEQYAEMMRTSGNYKAPQFLEAGEALLSAKSFDTARQAYDKAMELAKAAEPVQTNVIARALIGQANTYFKEGRFAEAHEALDKFIGNEMFSRSPLVVDANFMLIEVASEEGRREKDDAMRMKYFNAAVGAIKKVRNYRKEQAQQDELDLMSGDVLVRKMEAEEAMGAEKAEQAKETCGRAVVTFVAFLMAHEPTPEHPFDKMTPAQQNNLERCYGKALPLMAKLGKSQAEQVIKYGETYLKLFPEGKSRTAVQNALNQARAE
ncbi:MAG: hypothetical protein IKO72_13350 [Kiritimatiellae bacterium]|nr:hypothetical protein [Kiritimatiellia bacterium]